MCSGVPELLGFGIDLSINPHVLLTLGSPPGLFAAVPGFIIFSFYLAYQWGLVASCMYIFTVFKNRCSDVGGGEVLRVGLKVEFGCKTAGKTGVVSLIKTGGLVKLTQ